MRWFLGPPGIIFAAVIHDSKQIGRAQVLMRVVLPPVEDGGSGEMSRAEQDQTQPGTN